MHFYYNWINKYHSSKNKYTNEQQYLCARNKCYKDDQKGLYLSWQCMTNLNKSVLHVLLA